MMSSVAMMLVLTWQHMVFDPAPMFDALVSDNARRSECRAGRYRRGDLYHCMIPCMAAGPQLSAMSDRAECQTAARTSRPPNRYARACPGGFLFERAMMTVPMFMM